MADSRNAIINPGSMYAARIPALKQSAATPITVFTRFRHIKTLFPFRVILLKVYAAFYSLTTKKFKKTIDIRKKYGIIQKLHK